MATKTPGYHPYNAHETLNFMLNRLAWDVDHEQLMDIGARVSNLDNFIEEMLNQAVESEDKKRLLEAGFFYRGAEFFMSQDHPQKDEVYKKFMDYFYQEIPNAAKQRTEIPYQGGKLGTIDIPAQGEEKGVIVCCSGFDGLIEELYGVTLGFAENGYRVILYEGTGQGSAVRWTGLKMTHDWENPTKAVLDHYNIESCTLIGVSLGGFLAPRAAAFEPRVKRVVCWGAMQNFAECVKMSMGEKKANALFRFVGWGWRSVINAMAKKSAEADPGAEWAISHGMHTSGKKDAFEFFKWQLDFDLESVAHLIKQDALLIQGTEDHLVSLEQLENQSKSLVNANSVSTRVATTSEYAAQHCQIGNPQLVIDTVLLWLEGLDRRDKLLNA